MLNNVTIMGRLSRDPELKTTQTGVPVLSFSIAVDRDYKPKDGERETDFIDCVAWRTTAEFISKYFVKGQLLAVIGKLQTRSYDDKDGNKRRVTEVVVEQAYFTGDKRNSSQNAVSGVTTASAPVAAPAPIKGGAFFDDEDPDGLPF